MSRLLNTSQTAEIGKIIKDYKPNPSVLKQFRASKFAVIAGPAAAGKDTLRNALVTDDKYVAILSTTTRPARKGEVEGKTYYFTDYETIKAGLKAGEYFQVALVHNQQVSTMHVGEIQKLSGDKIGLSILIVQVERKLHKLKPNTKTIFLIPPRFDELMERLKRDRLIDEAEINRRLLAAKEEIKLALDTPRYQCIVSDKREKVQKTAREFLSDGRMNKTEDARSREVMRDILERL